MTIDERLEFLLQSTESVHATAQQNAERVAELTRTAEAHEREIQRFRRAMRAALTAWLEEEGENGKQT